MKGSKRIAQTFGMFEGRKVDMRYRNWGSAEELVGATTQALGLLQSQLSTPPKLRGEAPIPQIVYAVKRIALDPDTLSTGDFLSRLMRLPPIWRMSAMEFVNNDGGNQNGGFELTATLLNAGPNTVRYLQHSEAVPVLTSDGRPTDRTNTRKIWSLLEPGEVVDLRFDMAVHLLWDRGRYARPFAQMQLGIPAVVDRPIVEVAYRARWIDVSTASGARFAGADSEAWQRDRVAEIVESASHAVASNRDQSLGREQAMGILGTVCLPATDAELQAQRANIDAARAHNAEAERVNAEAIARGEEPRDEPWPVPELTPYAVVGEHYWWPRTPEFKALLEQLRRLEPMPEGSDAAVRTARPRRHDQA